MTDRERFAAIRARWERVQEQRTRHGEALVDHYRRSDPPRSWQTRGELKRGESIQAAESKVGDAMFTLLDRIGARQWRGGVPFHWVMDSLTYDDAVATGALSVIPPTPYGYRDQDMMRFASAG